MEGVYTVSCQSWEGQKNQIIKKNQSWGLKVYGPFFFLFYPEQLKELKLPYFFLFRNTKFRYLKFQNRILENELFFAASKEVGKCLVYILVAHYITIYKIIILLKLFFGKKTNVSIFHFIKKWKFKTITWRLFSNGQWLQFS